MSKKLISHRGNIDGRKESFENSPSYIDMALSQGYDVEIDIWYIDNELFLGHDIPQYNINIDFLNKRYDKIWIHCKNIDALYYLINFENLNIFFHDIDDVTLTSSKYMWTYPGKKITEKSIAVMPETVDKWDGMDKAYGICSDNISKYKINYE